MDKKVLVAYFSASGVTARAAKALASAINADLYEILPAAPYTKADLDWTDKNSRSSIEMNDKSFRPPIAEPCPDLSGYDTVFLGFPIWWYVAPTLVNTFLESGDFSGKRVILFATSGSSGFGRTAEALRPSVSASCIIEEGKLLNGKYTQESLAGWAGGLLKK